MKFVIFRSQVIVIQSIVLGLILESARSGFL